MLVTEVTMRKACPKNANLAEQFIGPKKKIMTSTGEVWKGETLATYMDGMPLDDGTSRPVLAPVDLQAGDLVLVASDENMVYKVFRADKQVYINAVIEANLEAQKKERLDKRGFYAGQR